MNHSRHVLHAPVPCRPQPIKSSPVALPWVSSPATNQVLHAAKSHLPRFANLIPAGQRDNPKRQGFGQSWHKQSTPKSSDTEPTVLFRLKSLSEHMESQSKPQEKKEASPIRLERVSAGGPSEVFEGPLDLSDRGKSKSGQSPTDFLPLAFEREQNSPDKDVKNKPSTHGSLSPRGGISSSSSPRPTVRQPEGESGSENETKVNHVSIHSYEYLVEAWEASFCIYYGFHTADSQRAETERGSEWKGRPKQRREGACPYDILTSR